MEAHEKAVKARWQVATYSSERGYYVVAWPLTAAEAQEFLDGLPFHAWIEPCPSGQGAMIPVASH